MAVPPIVVDLYHAARTAPSTHVRLNPATWREVFAYVQSLGPMKHTPQTRTSGSIYGRTVILDETVPAGDFRLEG